MRGRHADARGTSQGFHGPALTLRRRVTCSLLETMNCIPVFMPVATQRDFYDGYCRDTLWPVFHNVIDVYGEVPTRYVRVR